MRKFTFCFFGIFIGMLSGMPGMKAQCGFTLNVSVSPVTCPGACDGSASVSITGYSGAATFDWSPGSPTGDGTADISNLCEGMYTVMVTDSNGCSQFYSGTVSSTPSICMVTTDAHSINNFIYWDKTLYPNVDSFIVYREVAPGSYARIAAVSSDSLSQFEDTTRSVGPAGANGDPNTGSYKYKLQARYSCGTYSALSPYHNTIYIIDAGAGEFSWAVPYTIEGTPNPVISYILLCDTANVDIWGPVSSVPGTDTTATDPGFASHSSIANWRVKTNWPIACTPTRTTVNTTRSNIKHAPAISTGILPYLENNVLIYPNPAGEMVTIEYAGTLGAGTVSMFNALGEKVYEEAIEENGNPIHTKRIGTGNYAGGVYTVFINTGTARIYRKLVIK